MEVSNQSKQAIAEVVTLFTSTFLPADQISNADAIKSMHEMKAWFLEQDMEISGTTICAELKKHGFEMVYTGGMYLFLLKNK